MQVVYLAPAIPPTNRGIILSLAIEFEYDFQLYMLAILRKINPEISEVEFGKDGIFVDPNMLSSLAKCLNLAEVLGMLSQDEQHDIRKFVKLRNMYAHGRDRTDIKDDERAKAVLYSMKIYANSKQRLDSMNAGDALFCCVNFLSVVIKEKRLKAEGQ